MWTILKQYVFPCLSYASNHVSNFKKLHIVHSCIEVDSVKLNNFLYVSFIPRLLTNRKEERKREREEQIEKRDEEGGIYFHSFNLRDEFFILQKTYHVGSQNFSLMNKVFDL